jgi:hexulose-6-phosphate isomerase
MNSQIDRRWFLKSTGLALAGAAAPALLGRPSAAMAGEFAGRIKKAAGFAMVQGDLSVEDKLRLLKDAGFDGVEVATQGRQGAPSLQETARASEKAGLPVHGVVHSSNTDLKSAIDEAAAYGAASVLHVVRSNRDGSYMDNYRETQEIIRRAIPYAEQKKVYILIENVWATFLIDPLTMARYIDELDSPYVKAYLDIGNVMRWGWPHHWIEVLGKRVVKVHVKEYNLDVAMKEGMGKGFDFPIGGGSIDWAKVRQELKKIDYRGWATAEVRGGDRQRLAEIAQQMDRVLDL